MYRQSESTFSESCFVMSRDGMLSMAVMETQNEVCDTVAKRVTFRRAQTSESMPNSAVIIPLHFCRGTAGIG